MPLLRCPNCNKVLTEYINGFAEYRQKCHNCKEMIRIYSAGQTLIYKEKLSFIELDKMMRTNLRRTRPVKWHSKHWHKY